MKQSVIRYAVLAEVGSSRGQDSDLELKLAFVFVILCTSGR